MIATAIIRNLGQVDYAATCDAMRSFTDQRDRDSRDELWFLEHPPVFTLGINANSQNVLEPGDIPVIHTDRGGQVTYHGPGQLVVYPLLDLRRASLSIGQLVSGLENAVIKVLRGYGIAAASRTGAPGVYAGDAKIASIGLRVRRGCCYHGLAVNVSNELEPFQRINPCGFEGLAVTRIAELGGPDDPETVAADLARELLNQFGLHADTTNGQRINPVSRSAAEAFPAFRHPTRFP